MRSIANYRPALLALFGGGVAIGFAPILFRLAEIGPSATGFFRVLFALPILWLLLAREMRSPQPSPPPRTSRDFALLAAAGAFFVADLAMWHWSLQLTSVTNSTLLTNLSPVYVTLGAWLLYNETITGRFVLGIVLALGGASLLIGNSPAGGSAPVWGDLLASLTAIFYAGYVLLVKRLRRRLSPLTIMAWSSLASCALFLAVALISDEPFQPAGPKQWAALLALALITHVGGQTLIAYALGRLPASLTSAALFLQPIVAAGLAWALLGEPLSPIQVIGGLTALAGITVATRPPQPPGREIPQKAPFP